MWNVFWNFNVEDEEMIREGIKGIISTDCGYEIIEAADGQEALEKFFQLWKQNTCRDIQLPNG